MIVVVDYDMGNLGSVAKALAYLGHSVRITSDPKVVVQADRLILPGVGAMSYAMQRLRENGLDQALKAYVEKERPFLGICLGMQLFFESSEEGETTGLGILPGVVCRFPESKKIKIPHMGWNRIADSRLSMIPEQSYFYFVHSYYVQPNQDELIAARATHGVSFAAAVQTGSVLLTQFHPEKSGAAGLDLLQRWLDDPPSEEQQAV